jgi:hypothetical protein
MVNIKKASLHMLQLRHERQNPVHGQQVEPCIFMKTTMPSPGVLIPCAESTVLELHRHSDFVLVHHESEMSSSDTMGFCNMLKVVNDRPISWPKGAPRLNPMYPSGNLKSIERSLLLAMTAGPKDVDGNVVGVVGSYEYLD